MSVPISHLCRYLRWKSQSRESGEPRWVLESLIRSQTQFSCLKTCQPWGPDDDAVAPECCTPERSCYVPDPLVSRQREVS
jgi:hypothetical protein